MKLVEELAYRRLGIGHEHVLSNGELRVLTLDERHIHRFW